MIVLSPGDFSSDVFIAVTMGSSQPVDQSKEDDDSDGDAFCRFYCKHPCGEKKEVLNPKSGPLPSRRCEAVCATVAPECAGMVCAFSDGCLGACVWPKDESERTLAVKVPHKLGEVKCLNWDTSTFMTRNGRARLCTGTDTGFFTEWLLESECGLLAPTRTLEAHAMAPNHGARFSGVTAVALHSSLAVTGCFDGSACIWSATSERNNLAKERQVDGGHGGAVTAVAVGEPVSRAVTAGEDGIVRLWSDSGMDMALPMHGKDRMDLLSTTGMVSSLSFDTRHGRLCTGAKDGFVRLWDVSIGRPTRRFLHAVAGSPGGQVQAAFSRGDNIVPQELGDKRHEHNAMANRQAKIGLRTMAEVPTMPLQTDAAGRGVDSVAFDTDGGNSTIISGGSDGSWLAWDVRESSPVISKIEAHQKIVASVAVLGHQLVSASLDGTAAIWDLRRPDKDLVRSQFSRLRPIVQRSNIDEATSEQHLGVVASNAVEQPLSFCECVHPEEIKHELIESSRTNNLLYDARMNMVASV